MRARAHVYGAHESEPIGSTQSTKLRQSMRAGATGLIFGRNVWQRSQNESLRFIEALRTILAEHPSELGSVLP